MNLLSPIIQSDAFQPLRDALAKPAGKAALFGVHPIHRALYAAALARARDRAVLFVCETDAEATTAAADIQELGVKAMPFLSRDLVFLDVEGLSHDTELARLAVLGQICDGSLNGAAVVCCSLEALCQFTMPKSKHQALSIDIKTGGTVQLPTLTAQLVAAGYTRGDRVEGRGQFAVRGGILDIFPAHSDEPVRIELFGDAVDAIATFDVETQRRTGKRTRATITPAREVVLGNDALAQLQKLAERCKGAAPALGKIVERDIALLADGITPAGTDRYLHTVYNAPETLLDYLPDAVLFLCEPTALQKRHKNLLFQHTEELLSLEQQGFYLKGQGRYYLEDIDSDRPTVFADVFTRTVTDLALDAVVNVRANVIPRWSGEFSLLLEDVRGYLATGYVCVVLAGTARAAAALASDLADAGLSASVISDVLPAPGAVGVAVASLSSGMELSALKLCVIASRREKKVERKRVSVKQKPGKHIGSLEDLRVGDYVVHQSHGIGRFDGIHRIDHHGLVRDYIKIKYQGEDTLYVPVTQLDMVSQYISPKGDDSIKLAKLHSGEWNKTKQTVYRSVREMAKELIELYAKRGQSEGIAFSKDNEWQHDFEARFAYDETNDQLRAVTEIKRDMEQTRPMDRLLCGDVGVGKTEVALRAIFKCVTDGYQCAVLVPTTILAWQHYHTFLERFEAYPIKVAMLSRFATAKEIREAIEGIRAGTVDVVVGTHRLLQKDVQFKKLGLLVVDEEQRFGVSHKEKLKQVFADVDVLTLSATPIPRTLNMAMSGIRDMSVIEEPPEDRHPVQTFVIEYDESILLDAIKRELARGGQVYYLHNRVETIERTAHHLSQLLPDASVEVAHGQMDEASLSEVWRRLLSGECDILVCTTIIETGVDVPNCNTLIVENADHMGLSQLYQIRGRVGRSGRRAFAYFTFRRDKVITDVAAKRLAAIRDFTSFGSGFKIAMRDLQIRGAGSVLSARQSGHMAAVGYDTYLKILEQAVSDESGNLSYTPPTECTVDLAVSAYISETYIPDNESRIEMYKRIAAVETPDDAEDVLDELGDRFGAPPEPVVTLVSVALIRAMASTLGFYEVTAQNSGATVILYGDHIEAANLQDYIRQRSRRILLSAHGKSHIAAEVKPGEAITDVATEVLSNYTL